MLTRLRKFLGKVLGTIFYWVGWGLAVLVIALAVILSIASGNPVVPLLLGGVGVIVWLLGIGARYILAGRNGDSMRMRRVTFLFTVISLAALCVVAFYFVFPHPTSVDGKQSLSLRFSWAGIPACASISPAFGLGGVPAGTKSLSFMMTDLNVPTFHHGGSTISYNGDAVSQGAISYTGPCPPPGERHNYRWTVQALDAAGKVLDSGSAEAIFPP